LRYNDAFFRFVFFADESINETIAKPGLNELTEGTIQIVSMPGFSQEQISSYLKYRINSCGNSVELPFSDSELEYLYEASGGLPGGINVLARKLMQEQLEKKKPDKKQGGKLLLLAGILLIITAYQYYENRLLKENHASLLKESQESLEAPVNAEKKLTLAAEEQFVIKQQSNENARSSTTHESLSLKLSEILIIQSRENNESIDTP
jgi:hypothetical protein